ncbi:histone deacetylase family protein [Mesorhizobium sp. RP14(2022)]|uniref:Histone deacetylase family protein n=1 Tax=Mesorhizobium liriopis TaxID=2953882 RepID=A0ABT1C5M6_9HYPH|nr:histone deacetylase family protein [Mesorhizobium liriopis]MCO6049266.1 histone deacetylase family protein [Mesorhizobium liriopis]
MKTVYSDLHGLQDAEAEFIRGKRVPSFEGPRRAELVLARVKEAFGLESVLERREFGLQPLLEVHDERMVSFLSDFWPRWSEENGAVDAFPNAWPPPRAHRRQTQRIGAELGRFCVDMSSPLMEGTWRAVSAGADVALTAQALVSAGDRAAFALCRPPGHHAGRDYFGGYCFLNNAAIAAQSFIDQGASRVAVLDVDYHHGNGTQDIFYDRGDVLCVSIHADPTKEYPYYLGYADETGEGPGADANCNLPLPWGSDYATYGEALVAGVSRIKQFGAEAVVISLGVDTFESDPISRFKLRSDDFLYLGKTIAKLNLPTVFVMEGGYAVEAIGLNVVNVLSGFENA